MKSFSLIFLLAHFCIKAVSQCDFNLLVVQHPSCQFNNEGILSVVNLQGTPPFSYLWTNGSTASSLDSLQADYYGVVVTDSFNCVSQHGIFLPSGNLQFTYNVIPPSCSFCYDGVMSVLVSNGTPPFSYLWSTSENCQSIHIGASDYY